MNMGKKVNKRKERIDEMKKQIHSYAKELAKLTDKAKFSKEMKNYFSVISKFHKYSWNNRILIYVQNENATRVAGFNSWKKNFGRTVKQGEKAIWIYAPRTYKTTEKVKKLDSDGNEIEVEEEFEHLFFVPVPVFDVSQTEGKPLPKIDYGTKSNKHPELLKKLETLCKREKIALTYEPLRDGLNGFSANKKITINSKLSVDEQVTTLIHEIGHELLHWNEDRGLYDTKQKETEAEAVGFIVARFFGVDTKAFNYLALYNSDSELILNSLERISKATSKILYFLNGKEN